MLCHVKTPIRETISIEMNPSDTVKDIKRKIEERKGFPLDKQCLTFEVNTLEDNCALSTYNLQTISILHLTFKPEGLCTATSTYMYVNNAHNYILPLSCR